MSIEDIRRAQVRAGEDAVIASLPSELRSDTPGGFVRKPAPERKHNHYFKPVSGLSHVDVYRVLHLFSVTDPCLQHAVKKLLVAGGRGGGKDISRDIQEAIDTLKRWQDMRAEETTTTTN